MFQKVILALTAAATLTGASMALSAPAEAHDWHYWGHNWGHYGYWHPHYFVGNYYGPNCYWTREPVRVWTSEGYVWEHRPVRVCN